MLESEYDVEVAVMLVEIDTSLNQSFLNFPTLCFKFFVNEVKSLPTPSLDGFGLQPSLSWVPGFGVYS